MTNNGNSVNISALGASHKLKFYYAVNGTPGWHGQRATQPGTVFSAPSMNTDGNDVNIAFVGSQNRLRFVWAVNGTMTWHGEQVAPPGSVR